MQRSRVFQWAAPFLAFVMGTAVQVPMAQIPAKSGAVTAAASALGGQPLDLNTASPEQLKAIPGIGDAYAKRIVNGRPYTAKNQLVTKGVLPQNVYDKIKDSVVARRAKA